MQAQKFYFIYFKKLCLSHIDQQVIKIIIIIEAQQQTRPTSRRHPKSSAVAEAGRFYSYFEKTVKINWMCIMLSPPSRRLRQQVFIHSACVVFFFPIIIWSTTGSDALIDQQQGPEGRLQWSWSSVSQVLEGKGVIWFKWSEFFKPKFISCMAMRMLDSLYCEGNYKTDSMFCTFLSLQKIPFEGWMMSAFYFFIFFAVY